MYKVMLVDDDYPVLELLSETIKWEQLGLKLQSTHENGASALEHALIEMPDILITDIGMPKMNGIELTRRMREINPTIQVSMLTCHNEFEYARQALQLNVQDYLLKDTLNPEDLTAVLIKVKDNLDKENEKKVQEFRLRHIVEQNRESMKRDFLRKTIYQPIYDEDDWYEEAASLGIELRSRAYIPTLCFMQNSRSAKDSFISEDTLVFSIQNVIGEVLREYNNHSVHMTHSIKESFILFPYSSNLKSDCYGAATDCMRKIQKVILNTLNISLSFIIGDVFDSQKSFRVELDHLLQSTNQRFYMEKSSIEKKKPESKVTEGLFSLYDQVSVEIRQLIIERDLKNVTPILTNWTDLFKERGYSSEHVKDWVLKLLLDLKVKLKALQFFGTNYSDEVLHEEILGIDSLDELRCWLNKYFESLLSELIEMGTQSRRKEVIEACKYVSINLEKKITLDEVANQLYLNSSYFSRLFKKEVGETFVEYVTKAKMNRAKELLEQTIDPVGKICERLGYDNQSYFIKVFKSYVGVTPIEFRGERVG
ncbi:response regulator transcription factor [Litchfieldia salsa]|uniref:Two-component system, response regulator YesN n=1 Tax=Litchfieldia salsa TaxID=930152 RepID=A0A1H0Q6F1_9BACI|nr:response regulator [Litchfieldia salsa]SDP12987.1 two-component system, response regulator YesN [Litchfieldia salsa]